MRKAKYTANITNLSFIREINKEIERLKEEKNRLENLKKLESSEHQIGELERLQDKVMARIGKLSAYKM